MEYYFTMAQNGVLPVRYALLTEYVENYYDTQMSRILSNDSGPVTYHSFSIINSARSSISVDVAMTKPVLDLSIILTESSLNVPNEPIN